MRTTAIVIALLLMPIFSFARSALDGLELTDSEKQNGVEILTIDPASPAARAMLLAGDRITAISGFQVASLDDYVRVSKLLGKRQQRVSVEYYRAGVRHTAEISLTSAPLREMWKVNIVPWREMDSTEEKGRAEYWLDRARTEREENEKKDEKDLKPADYGGTLLSLFTALHLSPDSISTAILVGQQYGELATSYHRSGDQRKAIWCLRRAMSLYMNSLQKASGIQELVLVKNGLENLQKALVSMK